MAQSLAERFRAARLAFEAGVAMGCSPRDAAARLRWQDSDRRLRARQAMMDCGSRAAVTREVEAQPQPTLWYQQGDMA
jgi:hypothetical protein